MQVPDGLCVRVQRMSTAWEHDRSCDAPCSICKSDWECPYMGIACDLPRDKHFCPKCDPNEATCRECGVHSDTHRGIHSNAHLYGCSKFEYRQ